jgi:hypothetical protein
MIVVVANTSSPPLSGIPLSGSKAVRLGSAQQIFIKPDSARFDHRRFQPVNKSALAMNVIRSFIRKGGDDIEEVSPQTRHMLDGQKFEEHVEVLSQTPSLDTVAPSQLQGTQRLQTTARTSFSTAMKGTPRPLIQIYNHSGKMLALPITTVRSVDLNEQREPGYMGINPITLMGEAGLLPGSWGARKEYVAATVWQKPPKQPREQEPAWYRTDPGRYEAPQRKPDEAVIDLHELRIQHAQAVLDGDAVEESSVESNRSTFATRSLPKTLHSEYGAAAAAGYYEDWADVTDEEEQAVDGQKKPGRRREDSKYSSGDDASTLKTSRPAKWPVVRRRQEACSRRRSGQKQQEEWRACKSSRCE